MRALVALVLSCGLGCSPCSSAPDDADGRLGATVAADTCTMAFRVGDDAAGPVSDAFAMWNGVAREQLCVRPGGPWAVRIIPDHGPEWHALLAESIGGVAFIGLTRPAAKEIVVVDGLAPEAFARVIRHETGHALGLGHVVGPAAVMSPAELYAADALTAADVAECWRVGACR